MKNQKITFDSILDSIVDKNSISKTFARSLIKELTELIREGLLKDNTVNLAGFGIFKLHSVPGRTGRNVQNGQPIQIPAHRKVLFKPEKHIRELINKKYEDLKAQIPGAAHEKPKTTAAKTKDPTESEITLSAITKSLDNMVKEEPKKKDSDTFSNEPVLKDDILGVEEKEKTFKEVTEEGKSNKKLYIGASIIAVLLILLLLTQFGSDEADQVEIAENEKPVIESVAKKQQKAPSEAVKKAPEKPAVTMKNITSVKGDNLWDLAFKHYNDGYLWPLILQANKTTISNPDLIEPGVELKIPVIANAQKLSASENKLLSDGHLTAYFAYKKSKKQDALNHLFVADRYDHQNVLKSLAKIDQSDYQSIQNLSMK